MSFARKWMELKIIMLSEISQTHKDKCHNFLSYVKPRKKKMTIREEERDQGMVMEVEMITVCYIHA
jgi:hypothetical protein